jgi:hypothetical protein
LPLAGVFFDVIAIIFDDKYAFLIFQSSPIKKPVLRHKGAKTGFLAKWKL